MVVFLCWGFCVVKWCHVVSVGTSLLANFERLLPDKARVLGVMGWSRLPPGHEDQFRAEEVASSGLSSEVYRGLLEFLEEDPRGRSAELNAFLRYTDFAGHSPPQEVEVILYTSDTGTGWLVGSILGDYLRSKGYVVTGPIRVERLGRSTVVFEEGLVNLLDKVFRLVVDRKRKGVRVYLNATAGYKPETTFMVIAGMLLGVDGVYYIHEVFREPVMLPTLPLTIRHDLVELLRKLDRVPEKPYSTQIVEEYGFTVKELVDKGLVSDKPDKIVVRRWAKILLDMIA